MTQSVSASIEIDAPPEQVWPIVNDPRSYVEAIDWVREIVETSELPLVKGGYYIERAKPGPKEGVYRWEVTELEEPRRVVHSHAGSEIEADLELILEPLPDDRTRYSQLMSFRALPGFRPLGAILERTVMKRQMQRDFDQMILPNLKRLVESERTTS